MSKDLKQNQAQEYLDGWKRCKADFENFKVAVGKEILAAKDAGKIEILKKILPTIDGLGMVIEALENALDLEEVDYEKFDPALHESISGEGDKIEEVRQRGFKLNGKLVRPARVRLGKET